MRLNRVSSVTQNPTSVSGMDRSSSAGSRWAPFRCSADQCRLDQYVCRAGKHSASSVIRKRDSVGVPCGSRGRCTAPYALESSRNEKETALQVPNFGITCSDKPVLETTRDAVSNQTNISKKFEL